MINQFKRRKFYLPLFVLFAFLLIPTILIFSGSVKSFAESKKDAGSQDENFALQKEQTPETRWLAVAESELRHIQRVKQNKGENFAPNIVEKQGALSVVEADEAQILDLTRSMHEEFDKCAGFMSFETREAAERAVEDTLRAEENQTAAVYSIDNQVNVNPMLAEVKEAQILETITRLSTDFPNRRYNQPSGVASANWIKNKWTEIAAGRSDIAVEFFNHPAATSPQPSIILTVRGTALPDEVVVLGGHQDSINHAGAGPTGNAPGADDDASGIASLTETIRVLVAKNFRPRRTVKFMAYAAEEVGLVGSNAIAADFKARGVNVVGALQLDMTNYKSSQAVYDIRIITDSTNAAQNQFLRDLLLTYQPSVDFADGTCGYYCSDHASWNSQGFAASFPFEPYPSNQTIHTTADTLAQSGDNAVHAVKYSKLAVSYVGELAKGTTGLSYESDLDTRPNGDGAVTSTDVSIVQGFQLGIGLPYQSNEFQRADCAPFETRGDGQISSIDVSQAQAYQLGFNLSAENTWQPAAGPTEFAGFFSSQPNLLASGGLFDFRTGAENGREVRIVETNSIAGQTVIVPIAVDAAGDESVYGFSLNYDETKLSNPVVSIGSAGGSVSSNTARKGKIGFSVSFAGGAIAAGGNQRLVAVRFTVAENASAATALTFNDAPTIVEVAGKWSEENGVRALPTNFSNGIMNISPAKSRKRNRFFQSN